MPIPASKFKDGPIELGSFGSIIFSPTPAASISDTKDSWPLFGASTDNDRSILEDGEHDISFVAFKRTLRSSS